MSESESVLRVCCQNTNGSEDTVMQTRVEKFVEEKVLHLYEKDADDKDEKLLKLFWKLAWKEKGHGKEAYGLLVGNPAGLRLAASKQCRDCIPCVAVLPDNRWDDALDQLLRNPRVSVLLVIRGKEEDFRDEDALRMAEALKRLSRERLRVSGDAREEDISKQVDWKCSMNVSSSSFVSFFSDPAMLQMGRELKHALLSVDRRTRDANHGRDVKNNKIQSILLLGETGTGKTLAAKWIAERLDLKMGEVNIAAMSENMIDRELFGTVKGAYTGADKDAPGLLEEYKGQVVFLDEIGDMPPACQVRLLKYLDSGDVRRMGATKVEHCPAVVVAATNRPLDQWAAIEGSPFRSDLYHRFDHVVKIPSLKERREDMRLLISLILQDKEVNERDKEGKFAVPNISVEAIEHLEAASYPGNFRDLRNRIRTAVGRAAAEGAQTLCLRHLV